MTDRYKRIIVNCITAVLVVVLCFVLIFRQNETTPDNPIVPHSNSIVSEVMVAMAGTDGTTEGQSNGNAADGEEKDEEKEQENEIPEEQLETSEDAEEDSSIDGINDSDKASDAEGSGVTGDESLLPDHNENVSIATDLRNQVLTESQLKENTFGFYAYLVHPEDNMKLKVKLRNTETPQNGKYLKSSGKNYEAHLTRGYNYITLYIKQGNTTYYQITYAVNYMADKADANKPQVGEHPPIVKTNLDDWKGDIKNSHFIFVVEANDYKGKGLPYDYIRITVDGNAITYTPSGSLGAYEYDIMFDTPKNGRSEQHNITVLAWDEEGNSTYKSYDVTYRDYGEGAVVGKVSVTIDATTLGLGIIKSGYVHELKQNEPASSVIMAAMKYYGCSADYSGTVESGFYLRSITHSNIARGAKVPDNLWSKIIDDGLSTTGQHNNSTISEFDYTQGSGWMYTINGALYPGRGLSSYYLNDGDSIILRFTLAYGKDLGSTSSQGLLSSYCGAWINGGFTPMHRLDDGTVIKAATCETPGVWARQCTVKGCKEKIEEQIPALGHADREISRDELMGDVTFECDRCHRIRTESYDPSIIQ